MNLNQLMNMIGRMVLRRFVNIGISKVFSLFSRRGKTAAPPTAEEQVIADDARMTERRARQAARIARRTLR
jgi:hypothetical protein